MVCALLESFGVYGPKTDVAAVRLYFVRNAASATASAGLKLTTSAKLFPAMN